jgi:peptidoglycan/LPS O-acetylase OafA/YrhL
MDGALRDPPARKSTAPAARRHDGGARAQTAFLDEMRGLAALAVCLYHVGTYTGAAQLMPNGYLAVDFFFMLSGFVLAEAYGDRLGHDAPADREIALGDFVRRRLIRMAPMVVLGAGLGSAYLIARWFVTPDRSDRVGDVLLGSALNLVLVPKVWVGAATRGELFPSDGPLWSLFFELLANVAWAASLVRRSTAAIGAGVFASALVLMAVATRHGSMNLGWELKSIDGGLARIGFGFAMGLLLHRLRHRLPAMGARHAALAAGALLFAMALPVREVAWTMFVAIVLMPAVLALSISAGRYHAIPGGRWLGRISYPLYGIHVPLLSLYAGATEYLGHGEPGTGASALLPFAMVPTALVVAAWLTTAWEEPARAALTRRFGSATVCCRPRIDAAGETRPN